jgi:uncharacterized protein (DUF342 family)
MFATAIINRLTFSSTLQASQWQRQYDSQQHVIESHERELKDLQDALQVLISSTMTVLNLVETHGAALLRHVQRF